MWHIVEEEGRKRGRNITHCHLSLSPPPQPPNSPPLVKQISERGEVACFFAVIFAVPCGIYATNRAEGGRGFAIYSLIRGQQWGGQKCCGLAWPNVESVVFAALKDTLLYPICGAQISGAGIASRGSSGEFRVEDASDAAARHMNGRWTRQDDAWIRVGEARLNNR